MWVKTRGCFQVVKVLMISEDCERVSCSLQPVVPLFQGKFNCQQLTTHTQYHNFVQLKKKATRWTLGFSPKHWYNIPFAPDSEASTSMMKGLDGSGCSRMGDVVKVVLSLANASSAAWFHFSRLGPFLRRAVRGEEMELKPHMNHP